MDAGKPDLLQLSIVRSWAAVWIGPKGRQKGGPPLINCNGMVGILNTRAKRRVEKSVLRLVEIAEQVSRYAQRADRIPYTHHSNTNVGQRIFRSQARLSSQALRVVCDAVGV